MLNLDDNLAPGQTYTFAFKLGNLISLPDANAVMNEISQFAPGFLTNVGVSESSGLGLFTNYYNVTFTYNGDGSDVVSDVAQSIVDACAQGGDKFTFQSANTGGSGASATGDIQEAAGTVGEAAGSVVKGALGGATQGLGAWLIPVTLILVVVLLFELGGVEGLRKGALGR